MTDTGTAGDATGTESNEELRQQLKTLKSDLAELSEIVKKQARRRVEEAQDRATEKVEDLEAQIRKNPIQATMIAAGIGFLIGAILKR